MKARNGQVALYLVMVLLAIAVLMMVNVNAFLAVRSKNRMMNAVDGAALAAAKYQGHLLNEVGRMNVEHLRAAVLGEPWTDENGEDEGIRLRELTFLRPVEAIRISNEAAADWGFKGGETPQAMEGFGDHIQEIRQNPDLYPPTEGGENLWHLYASALASALAGNPAVLPSYMEMVNPGSSGLFANHGFYDVLAAKAWCWFSIGDHAQYLDGDPSQAEPYEITPVEAPENSEVYSLHVTYGTWMDSGWADEYIAGRGFSAKWTNFVCRVTGLGPEAFSSRSYAADETQVWAFYDDLWRTWSTTYNPDDFPIAGTIKPEYDVAGCVASCMMLGHVQQIGQDDEKRQSDKTILVTAEAKPLGTVEGLDGGTEPVTAYNRFIAPSHPGERIFTEAQLVLMGSVPRSPGVSMEPDWYDHVKKHAPGNPFPGCGYCKLWSEWSDPSFRSSIRDWLRQNAESCRASGEGGKIEKGGYEYAH